MAVIEWWKDVPGYEGLYQVSDQGNVRALRFRNRMIDKLRDDPYAMKPNWIKGYAHVTLWRQGEGKVCRVSVLVLLAFVGPRPNGMQAGHLDGVKSNNTPNNLAWVTPTENQYHRKLHGTASVGEKHALAKLTDVKVLAIREEFKQRSSYRYGMADMAKRYGVSIPTIQRIKRGVAWGHLL